MKLWRSRTYKLNNRFRTTLKSRVLNAGVGLAFLASTISGTLPLFMPQAAQAISSPSTPVVVYDALPSVSPATNYASLGYQATQTGEFGDYVHLAGTNRVLSDVTVTMSTWATYSTYASNQAYNSTNWSHPITLNVYSPHLGSNGVPDTLLATDTQTFNIPWRPEGNASCPDKGYGAGFAWKDSAGHCDNGLAFNINFDLSSKNVTLPDNVIVGVSYDTQSYGSNPIGVAGPYNSLNVAIPDSQYVSVGSDDSSDKVFWNTKYCSWYTDSGASGCGTFRQDSDWTPNGTVAMQITATAPLPPAAPTNLAILHNGTDVTNTIGNNSLLSGDVVLNFDAVTGASQYITEVTYPDGSTTEDFWNSYHNTWLVKNSAVSQGQFSAHGQGVYSYKVKDKNGTTGLWSGWSPAVTLGYDTTRPSVTVVSPVTDPAFLRSSDSIVVNATDNVALKRVTTNIYTAGSNTLVRSNSTSVSGTNYTLTTGLAGLSDGDYFFKANAQDQAGNPLSNTVLQHFTIDNTPPGAPDNLMVNGKVGPFYAKVGVGFTQTWSQPSSDTTSYNYLSCYTDAMPTGDTCPSGDTTWSHNYNTASKTVNPGDTTHDETFFWHVQAVDHLGNIGSWSYWYKVVVDSTKPTVSFVNPTDFSALFTAGPDVVVSASDATSGLKTLVIHAYDSSNNSAAKFCTATATELAAGQMTCDLSGLADGTYYIKAGAFDNSGNNQTINSGDFTIDSTGPAITVNHNVTSESVSPVTLTGTVKDLHMTGGTVNITVDGHTYVGAINGTANFDGSYNWSADVTNALAVGTYDVTVDATDQAGNLTSFTALNDLVVTAAAPITLSTPAAVVFTGTTNGGGNGNTNNGGNGNGNTNNGQAVLGASTTNTDNTGSTTGSSSDVKGDSTTKDTTSTNSKNFLGLGWWWLAVLAALALLWWFVMAKRRKDDGDNK